MTDFVQNHPDGVVLAMDAMSLYFQATVTQVWLPVGHTPEIYVSGSRDHIHFYGALNLPTGHQFALPTARLSAQTTRLFFEDVLVAYPTQPVLLFLDRAPWHTAKLVSDFFTSHPRLQPVHFPPACPDLNPQEQVWSQARAAISHNHTFPEFSLLKSAFLDFLSTTTFTIASALADVPPILRQLLGQV